MAKKKLSTRIVERILEDLKERRGFRQQWDATDPAMRIEIQTAWEKAVHEELQ
jgi:hypothetical protein